MLLLRSPLVARSKIVSETLTQPSIVSRKLAMAPTSTSVHPVYTAHNADYKRQNRIYPPNRHLRPFRLRQVDDPETPLRRSSGYIWILRLTYVSPPLAHLSHPPLFLPTSPLFPWLGSHQRRIEQTRRARPAQTNKTGKTTTSRAKKRS